MSMHAPYDMEHPDFGTIAGVYARPRTKRVFLHRPGDVCIVEARPDFTFLIKDAISPEGKKPLAGYGFLLGKGMEAVDIERVAKSFADGRIPILSQSAALDGVAYTLTALCADRWLRLRLTAQNTHPALPLTALLHFSTIQTSLGELYEHPNEDYVPFRADNRPWLKPLGARLEGDSLMLDGAVRAVLSERQGFDTR